VKRLYFIILVVLLPLCAVFADSGEQDLFAEAESFYYAKNYSLALESYVVFTTRFPRSELIPDVEYRRALCFFYLNRFDESLALLERIEKRYRSTRYFSFIPFWKGLILVYQKDYANALALFDAYLQKTESAGLTAQAYYYKAVCEAETGRYESAQATVMKFLADYPGSEMYDQDLLLLAFVYFKRNNPDGTIALFANPRIQSLAPVLKNKFLLYYANALGEKNRREDAKTVYKNLLSADSATASVALAKLFTLAQKANAFQEMEDLVRRAEEKYSDNPVILVDFWTNIGIASFYLNQWERAEYYFNRAFSFRDRISINESVPLYLAELSLKKGNPANALAVLEGFLAEKEKKPEVILFRVANLSATTGDFAKAVKNLNLFIETYPKSTRLAQARYLLAYSYYRTLDIDKALAVTSSLEKLEPGDPLSGAVVKLNSRLLLKKGETQKALLVLENYIMKNRGDFQAQRDYVHLLFIQKKYKEVIATVKSLTSSYPGLKKENPALYFVLKYFEGLSRVAQKEYSNALQAFSEFSAEEMEKYGLKDIASFAAFYRGWATYRLGKFREAALLFSDFIVKYPGHELSVKSLDLAGWCYYSSGDFAQAAKYFQLLAEQSKDANAAVKGKYFLAKTSFSLGKSEEAAKMFLGIVESAPGSEFAADALFEYAGILAAQGKTDAAAAQYLRLYESYPKSPLAEEALYKRAESLQRNKSWGKALEAFAFYRQKYPQGSLVDASLYWAGICAFSLGDEKNALALWEKLIQEYKDSSFRSEALAKAADIASRAADYNKALALYLEFIGRYPKEAQALNAEQKARELRYLVLGLSKQEAALTARIEQEKGKTTHPGRLAMIELAALYLNDKDGTKIDTAFSLLTQVLEIKTDANAAAQAQYLSGEYFSRKKDYTRAGNEFLKAALIDPANKELAAKSIYKSAAMMKEAGDLKTMRDLVGRLIANFPSSPWAEEGKKLLIGVETQ
jgi:TolA-binding protein